MKEHTKAKIHEKALKYFQDMAAAAAHVEGQKRADRICSLGLMSQALPNFDCAMRSTSAFKQARGGPMKKHVCWPDDPVIVSRFRHRAWMPR